MSCVLYQYDLNFYCLDFHGGGGSYSFNLLATFSSLKYSPFEIGIVNSCKGLLCVREGDPCYKSSVMHILNPFTGEYCTLPTCEDDWASYPKYWALGFSSTGNQFKIVRICLPYKEEESGGIIELINGLTEVYTLGSCSWTTVGPSPALDDGLWTPGEGLVNGSFHWLVWADPLRISAFNFDAEEFNTINLPSFIYADIANFYAYLGIEIALNFSSDDPEVFKLGVFREFLFLSCYRYGDPMRFEVWLMKEYAVVESWEKMFVVPLLVLGREPIDRPKFHVIFGNADSIICCLDNIMLCNLENITCNRLDDPDPECALFAVASTIHDPSFISLKDIVRGDVSS